MRIALVVGHHEKAQGAKSPFLKKTEWQFYNEVIGEFKQKHSEHDFYVFRHDSSIKYYTKRVKDTAERINKLCVDLVIELHFNAAAPSASGCETLYYYNSRKGKEYARKFTNTVCLNYDIRDRGIKALTNKKDRGFASVFYTDAPTILIEPFFGSNEKDCNTIGKPEYITNVLDLFLCDIQS